MDIAFSDLDLRASNPGWFTLCAEFTCTFDSQIIRVPVGFKTDLASIPRPLRGIFDRTGLSLKPAIVHDYLYTDGSIPTLPRKLCDKIFYACLRAVGVSAWTAWIYYAGVRMGGGWSFKTRIPV